MKVQGQVGCSANANNCSSFHTQFSHPGLHDFVASQMQNHMQKRDTVEGNKAMTKKTIKDQTYHADILAHLERHISKDDCADLLLNVKNPKMQSFFTSFDIKHVTRKAKHVANALRAMMDTPMGWNLWRGKNVVSLHVNKITTWPNALTLSWIGINFSMCGKGRFRHSGRGRSVSKALSIFAKNEEMLNKFKS